MKHAFLPALLLAGSALAAPPLPYGGLPTAYGFVALADMALAAPVVASADILSAEPLKGEQATGVRPGEARLYVQAATRGLVSGQAELPATLNYLVDLPLDVRGRPPRLKGVPVLLLLAGPPTASGDAQLAGPHAQVPRTPENEARLRALLRAKVAADAPPAILGVSRAFHVAGTLPGESETQIFLRTADARPISLNILRRPGQAPHWAVALSELVDNSAAPPPRDTLLWYRLACGLPPRLPEAALNGLADTDADAARADYQVVLGGLGPCERGTG